MLIMRNYYLAAGCSALILAASVSSGQAASSPKTDASKPPQEGTEWQAVIRDLKEQIAELKRDRAKTPARPHRRKSRPTST